MKDAIGNAALGGPGAPGSGAFAVRRWSDLSNPVIGSRLDTAAGRIDYDYFNGGVSFQNNARYPEEPIIVPVQNPHSILIGEGAVFRPHIHWLQSQAEIPNFLLAYKKMNNGDSTIFETDFSNFTFLIPKGNKFTYPGSGTILQLTEFPEIDISDLTISAQVTIAIFRDTQNTSGLFTGIDPVLSSVTVTYQDQHVLFDATGSREEFIK